MQYEGLMVLVRSYSAGVFAGSLREQRIDGSGKMIVVLDQSRRLWRWVAVSGAALSGVAVSGIRASESIVDTAVDGHTVAEVIEIIPLTEAAVRTLP